MDENEKPLRNPESVAAPADSARSRVKQPVRAISEDDDGYDPYSDYHDRPQAEPLFERDPWD